MQSTRFAVFAVVLALEATFPLPANSAPADIEIDLRDFTYVFASPNSAVGPWHVGKLDATLAVERDIASLRLVEGERDDSGAGAHGTFVRLEVKHRFTPAFQLKAALGSGRRQDARHHVRNARRVTRMLG